MTHSSKLKMNETGALLGLATVPVKNVSALDSHYRFKYEAEKNTGGVLS